MSESDAIKTPADTSRLQTPHAAGGDGKRSGFFAVVAGFGLAGRSIVNLLEERRLEYIVIEFNPDTVNRCGYAGLPIMGGDARDAEVLKKAGIERATVFAVTIPNEAVVFDAVQAARQMNPSVHIMARCAYTSGGMRAAQLGADSVIVAEQVVAHEFSRRLMIRLM